MFALAFLLVPCLAFAMRVTGGAGPTSHATHPLSANGYAWIGRLDGLAGPALQGRAVARGSRCCAPARVTRIEVIVEHTWGGQETVTPAISDTTTGRGFQRQSWYVALESLMWRGRHIRKVTVRVYVRGACGAETMDETVYQVRP